MISVSRVIQLLTFGVAVIGLSGCAADLSRVQAEFQRAPVSDDRTIVIARDVIVSPSNSYPRTLKAGSTWKYIGRIPQGSVFEIKDDVFMLEAKHMHHAHCVLAGDSRLVGFFLPVEQVFVALSIPVELTIQPR